MDRAKLAAAVLALVALAAVGIVVYSRGGGTDGASPSTAGSGQPARAPNAVPPAPSETTGTIAGTVRDAMTGDGIEGVDVVVRGATKTTTASGSRGTFEVRVPPGRYRVSARGAAHVSIADAPLEVAAGANARDVVVRVVALATVTGVVVDGDGHPLDGVPVSCAATLSDVQVSIVPGECVSRSDASGAFSLTVPPGRVELRAQVDGRPMGTSLLRWVAPGAELVGVELVVDHPASVAGVVRNRAGAALANAEVTVMSGEPSADSPGTAVVATTDAAGGFFLAGLAAGTVRLEARADGYGPSKPVAVDVSAGVDQTDVVLVVSPDAQLAGRVVDAAGGPILGATVTASRAQSRLTPRTVATVADGAFTVTGVARGAVDLTVTAAGFAPARRAGLSAPVDGLELRLERTGSIAGVVRANGATVAHMAVELTHHVPIGLGVRVPSAPALHFATADGSYRIDELAPGRYDMAVSARGFAPQVLLGVDVAPAATTDRNVELVQGARIAGTVTSGRSGGPVVGAFVQLSTGHTGEVAYTNEAGAFAIDDIAPGRRSVSFGRPGFVGHIESGIELHASDRRVVDAVLLPIESSTVPAGDEVIEFSGIGAALRWEDDALVVDDVVPRGPAAIAGLQSGDVVEAIDGVATRGRGLGASIEDIRGVVGTAVRLRIARADSEPFVLDIVRATVQVADPGEGE